GGGAGLVSVSRLCNKGPSTPGPSAAREVRLAPIRPAPTDLRSPSGTAGTLTRKTQKSVSGMPQSRLYIGREFVAGGGTPGSPRTQRGEPAMSCLTNPRLRVEVARGRTRVTFLGGRLDARDVAALA